MSGVIQQYKSASKHWRRLEKEAHLQSYRFRVFTEDL